MIGRKNVEAVLLDHNYCVPVSFDKEIAKKQATFPSIMADDNGSTLSWEKELGIEFDPPISMSLQSSSALSPSHSIDSGIENEMNLFADLDLYLGKNFDPRIDTLFSEEEATEDPTKKPSKALPYTAIASTSTAKEENDPSTEAKGWKVSPRQKKMIAIDEEEKNRKNAIAARENRQKKKRYVESIEKQNEELKRENEILKAKDKYNSKTVEKLENEISYLRNVIANQTTLSALLKSVVSTPGISFTSSFAPQEPAHESTPTKYDNDADDDDKTDDGDDDTRRYKTRGSKKRKLDAQTATPPSTKKQRVDVKGGICLHVNQDKVSLEFCQECSIKAHGIGHE